jgi:DNA replication protein DnaC
METGKMELTLGLETLGEALSELSREQPPSFAHPLCLPALTGREQRVEYCNSLIQRLGSRYAQCSFANYMVYEFGLPDGDADRPTQLDVREAVCDFAANLIIRSADGGGLVLYGRPGTGKDHLLAALMYWAVLRHGLTVKWVNGLELYGEARAVVAGNGNEEKFHRQLANPQVLAISDPLPPKGETTPYQAEVVQRVLDHRYRHRRPTWCTMNVTGREEAVRRLATPIIDRLRHGSLCLLCEWKS